MNAESLLDHVEAHRDRYDDWSTEDAVFGPIGPAGVADWYERLCLSVLGLPARRALFFAASAGCTAGIELANGQAIVAKSFQPRWRLDHLRMVSSVQHRLAAAGLACPVPEVPPCLFDGVPVSIDRFLADPGMRTLDLDEMAVSAGGLAETAVVLRYDAALRWIGAHPMDRASGSLYPAPHNPLFDFDRDADAAGWIDRLAVAGLAAQDSDRSSPQLIHGDWSARNIRVVDHGLAASYDWDSVAAFKESTAVGIAAAAWRSTGEPEDPPAPGPDEIDAYFDEYATVRGPVTRSWRTAAMGSALYALAYTARCEHALQALNPDVQIRRARHTLEADKQRFLAAVDAI